MKTGFTLIELLVVIAILGLVASVAVVAIPWGEEDGDAAFSPAGQIAAARRSAVSEGRSVTIELRVEGEVRRITAFPDGSVLGGEALGIDPLAGSAR